MTREEQIREDIRRVLNQMLDEEFNSMMKEVEDGTAKLSDRVVTINDIERIFGTKPSENIDKLD